MPSERLVMSVMRHLRQRGAASQSETATGGRRGRFDAAGGVTVLDRAGDNFFGEMVSA